MLRQLKLFIFETGLYSSLNVAYSYVAYTMRFEKQREKYRIRVQY